MFNYEEKIHAANCFIRRLTKDVPPNDTATCRLVKKMAWYACVCGWMTEDEARKHRDQFRMLRLHHALFGIPEVDAYRYCRDYIFLPKKMKGEIKLPDFMQAQ